MRPLPWVTTGRQTEKEEQWGLPGATAKIGEDNFPTWSTAYSHHPGSSGVHPPTSHSFHTRWRWVSTVSGGVSQTSATPMWSTLLHPLWYSWAWSVRKFLFSLSRFYIYFYFSTDLLYRVFYCLFLFRSVLYIYYIYTQLYLYFFLLPMYSGCHCDCLSFGLDTGCVGRVGMP